MSAKTESDLLLEDMAQGGGPVLSTLAQMSAGALNHAGISEQTALLVRFAALVALDAAPASYLVNLALAEEALIDPEAIRGTLAALAPLVGSARVVSAAGKVAEAWQLADVM